MLEFLFSTKMMVIHLMADQLAVVKRGTVVMQEQVLKLLPEVNVHTVLLAT